MIEWQPVVGFEGWYDVSNTGLVRRMMRATAARVGKILKPRNVRGYQQVVLSIKCDPNYRYIHHLVIEAFRSSRPSPEYQVNHKNGIKTDNMVENLEWVTGRQNLDHAYRNGLIDKRGEKHHNARLVTEQVLEIRRLVLCGQDYLSLSDLYGVSVGQIIAIVKKTRWKHV